MNDEALTPMADALSATVAVTVLLIYFFILVQVVAVSERIEAKAGVESEYPHFEFNVDFKETVIQENKLIFNQSYSPERDADLLDAYVRGVKQGCPDCDYFVLVSNYPQVMASSVRARKRSLSNALKLLPTILKNGMDYEINLTNNASLYYIELVGVRN